MAVTSLAYVYLPNEWEQQTSVTSLAYVTVYLPNEWEQQTPIASLAYSTCLINMIKRSSKLLSPAWPSVLAQ